MIIMRIIGQNADLSIICLSVLSNLCVIVS